MNSDSDIFYKNTLYSTIKLGIVCPMANERKTAEPFVRDVLGKTRFDLFKSGKLSLDSMVANGKIIKLADL